MVFPMPDDREFDAANPSTSFVRWLHAQKNADTSRSMPYARIYQWGKHIHDLLGADGRFDAEQVANELARHGATADDLGALVAAEAAWRVDTLVDDAESAGVSLDMPADTESEVSKALEVSDAAILCGYRNHRGEGCTAEAVSGAGRCGRHGGAITDPEVRRSFMLVAFTKIFDGTRVAVEALLDVAENGRSEMARVQAAKELLDRAGVQQDQHVHIHRPEEDVSEDELLAAIRSRMLETQSRLRLRAIEVGSSDYAPTPEEARPQLALVPASDDEIIDADIVEN
jgi:hypothetical protein